MKTLLNRVILSAVACMMAVANVHGASIYKTDFVQTPANATTTFNKGEFIAPPSWGVGSMCYHTTGSAGEVTITFTNPIDLTAYSNVKLTLYWGASSNRPVNLTINGGTSKEIDKVGSSSDRSKTRSIDVSITESSIKSLKFNGSGGGNSYYFQLEITGDGGGTVIPVAGVSLNKTELTLEEGKSEKLIPTVDPRGATNTNVTWSSADPTVATVDQQGNVTAVSVGQTTVTVKTDDGGFTATCAVTVTASTTPVVHVEGIAFAKSHTELTLYVNDTQQLQYSITPSDATNKAVTWSVNDPSVVSVSNGLVTALKKGDATVTVTTVDGGKTAESIIHVKEKEVPVPSTDLKLHEPELYEDDKGYGMPLTKVGGYEYEVYYYSQQSDYAYINAGASHRDSPAGYELGSASNKSTPVIIDADWLRASTGEITGSTTLDIDEFVGNGSGASVHYAKITNQDYVEMRVNGFDQFSMIGREASNKDNKFFKVTINNVEQSFTHSKSDNTIYRFNLSGESVIRITGTSSDENRFRAFSLRVGNTPRLRHLSGNDSTQNILQTQAMQPVTYYLKNKVSDAEFSWDGAEATGISMQKGANDTLTVSGTANCKNGVYKYTISAKDKDGKVISTKTGTITVSSKVAYQRMIDSVKTVYEKTSIEPVLFNYYSIDKSDLSWRWTSQTPAGLSFTVDESAHTLTLSGTPTTVGTFPYEVTLKDANTLKGKITVLSNSPTVVPGASKTMLYLYKTERTNNIYLDLTRKYNYFARPAGGAGKADSDYSDYDFIVISEDADANNDEVINIIKNVKKPVLNMKNFTYTTSRLGWGYPDNGSVNNTEITVLQPQHPVFKGMNVEEGGKIKLLSQVTGRGLMPSEITLQGSYALATALKQGAQYEADGEPETFLHEVPQATRGAKYILFPLSEQSAGNLTSDGRKLLQNVIEYLLSTEESKVVLPELKITSFSIDGHQAQIDEAQQEIHLELPEGTDLTQLTPQITLANQKTKVTPASGTTLNMSDSYFGVDFTVSDFINRKVYTAYITTATSLDDLSAEGLWYDGKVLHNPQGIWVNIYNVQGMLITTTNADYSFESQPQSMYMIVSERGVMKVMN